MKLSSVIFVIPVEHVACIKKSERPSKALYEAMVSFRSKAIVFTCTSCQKRGSIAKRLMQHEYERSRVEEERLASARLLEERDRTVANLQAVRAHDVFSLSEPGVDSGYSLSKGRSE